MSTSCSTCGFFDIEINQAEGTSFCTNCGTVLEENAIVSEVTFAETSNGGTALQGHFVSNERGLRSITPSFGFSKRMNPNESREITLAIGKRRIQALAAAVRLSEHHGEMAHRWFILAVQHNFTKGRKAGNVAAACLYTVCRQEKTSHMLLDFSEVLQVNVYVLGNTFLKLVRLLNLDLPLIDPSLFIGRFAAKLLLKDQTQMIASVALRLVARMKRDWIQIGRRPSGICGAALLIACRMHGIERSRYEIIKVVRVCDSTLRKRLLEFGETPSSKLTAEEFKGIWLEQEADPPSFKRKINHEEEEESTEIAEVNAKEEEILSFSGNIHVDKEMQNLLETDFSETTFQLDEDLTTLEKEIQENETELQTIALEPAKEEAKVEEEEESLTDMEDDEILGCILSEKEIEIKTKVWMEMNGDYVFKKVDEEKEKKPKKKREKTLKLDPLNPPSSAIEATKKMLESKKLSKKINYAALDELFASNTL